jgi:hypothetical protein
MTKAVAVVQLWISYVRAHARYYIHHFALHQSESTDIPGITIRIKRGKWLHYYTIGGHQ